MPWDGSGSFDLLYDFSDLRDEGPPSSLIDADQIDEMFADLAAGIALSMPRNGEAAATALQNFGGFRLTNLGDGTAQTDGLTVRQAGRGAIDWAGTLGGSATAMTATVALGPTTLVTGTRVRGIVSATNTTTTPTLAYNSTAATVIKRFDGSALEIGDLKTGNYVEYVYNGTNWLVLSKHVSETRGRPVYYTADATYNAGTKQYTMNIPAAQECNKLRTGDSIIFLCPANNGTPVTALVGSDTIEMVDETGTTLDANALQSGSTYLFIFDGTDLRAVTLAQAGGGGGGDLADLNDVDLTGIADGDSLYYDAGTWRAGTFVLLSTAASAIGDTIVWDGTDWTPVAKASSDFLLKTGGTMSGTLVGTTFNASTAYILKDVTTPANTITASADGDEYRVTGSVAGRLMTLAQDRSAQTLVDSAGNARQIVHAGNFNTYGDARYAELSGDTFTGAIAAPYVTVTGATGAFIFGDRGNAAKSGTLYGHSDGTIAILGSVAGSDLIRLSQDRSAQTVQDSGGTQRQIWHDGNINSARARTIVDAIQADATALNDLKTTALITVDGTYLNGDGSSGSSLSVDASALQSLHQTAFDSRYSLTSHTHSNASSGAAGFMSASDKSKLDGIASGATVGVSVAQMWGTGVGAILASASVITSGSTSRGASYTCSVANVLTVGGTSVFVNDAQVDGVYCCLTGSSNTSAGTLIFVRTA